MRTAAKRQLVYPRLAMSLSHQCDLLGLGRSSFYYAQKEAPDEMEILNLIAEIHGRWPYYGYRKVTILLRREGVVINRKRVQRLMKMMGLKAIYPGPNTSKPGKSGVIYPYLLKGLAIIRSNQVWSVDITYIRLPTGMVYLFALIDWFSRYIVGWKLGVTMEAEHGVDVLNKALIFGVPEITNMDQGSQFTGEKWLESLTLLGIKLSHTGVGRCIDNVRIERFWRSIKYEDIHLQHYESVQEARKGIGLYIKHYNESRPHQALNYKTPHAMYFANNEEKNQVIHRFHSPVLPSAL